MPLLVMENVPVVVIVEVCDTVRENEEERVTEALLDNVAPKLGDADVDGDELGRVDGDACMIDKITSVDGGLYRLK